MREGGWAVIIKRATGWALAVILAAAGAEAQILADQQGELRRQQQEQFERMFEDPDDLDLMFAYALTSIELQDYEAAISTLDRILIFNPNLPRVRLELAASYFRIGSYPVARHYFVQVIDNPETSEAVRARAEEFLDVIDQRTRQNYVTGSVTASAIFSTNANTGPEDRLIEFRGEILPLSGDDVTSQTDVGAALSAQVTHVYDLGGLNEDSWRTNVAAYSQRFASTEAGAADVLIVRTGPQLSVDDDRYGLKARPFVEFDHVRSANSALYTTYGGGVVLSNTLSDDLTVSADMRLGWRDFHDGGDKDGFNLKGAGTAVWFLDRSMTLRGRTLFEYEAADKDDQRNFEIGAEASLLYRYDSGFDFADRRWLAVGTVRASGRFFDAPGEETNFTERRNDFDLRLGLSNTAYVGDGWALVTRASYFLRRSNVRQFDIDDFTVRVGAQFSF